MTYKPREDKKMALPSAIDVMISRAWCGLEFFHLDSFLFVCWQFFCSFITSTPPRCRCVGCDSVPSTFRFFYLQIECCALIVLWNISIWIDPNVLIVLCNFYWRKKRKWWFLTVVNGVCCQWPLVHSTRVGRFRQSACGPDGPRQLWTVACRRRGRVWRITKWITIHVRL